ncbi:MAG TPA: ABC transporter permease [Anaerolineae bacterium]|nr:ABC transporter permease [Anaerolineae bacterium]HPL80309.1 ABC transporter permease [Burkholderiaceae bacterium]
MAAERVAVRNGAVARAVGRELRAPRTESPQSAARRHAAPRGNRLLWLGAALVGAVLALALVGLVYTPHDPNLMHAGERGLGPSLAYPMGTDQFGRDILSRVMRGAGLALLVGAVAAGIGLVAGAPLGALAGFARGWVDEAIMRLMDGLFAFPATLLAIAIVGALGPGLVNTMLAIGVAYVPIFARLARAAVIAQVDAEYVEAARAAGARPGRILWRHILPNGLSPLIVQATVAFGGAILAEAALSYLGLGVQPPDPSWGQMLNDARNYPTVAPWLAVFPGLIIAVTVLGFNLLGDGLRDYWDPRRRDA